MNKLAYWNSTWSLDEAQCPCDVHFVQYLEEKKVSNAAIFHFGTGNHHIVGLKSAEPPTMPCSASPPRRTSTTPTWSC